MQDNPKVKKCPWMGQKRTKTAVLATDVTDDTSTTTSVCLCPIKNTLINMEGRPFPLLLSMSTPYLEYGPQSEYAVHVNPLAN